jgi:hypothetical protein
LSVGIHAPCWVITVGVATSTGLNPRLFDPNMSIRHRGQESKKRYLAPFDVPQMHVNDLEYVVELFGLILQRAYVNSRHVSFPAKELEVTNHAHVNPLTIRFGFS